MSSPAINLTNALAAVVEHLPISGLEYDAAMAALSFLESIIDPSEWSDVPREELIERLKAEAERLRLEAA